jgi:hypothetical protein
LKRGRHILSPQRKAARSLPSIQHGMRGGLSCGVNLFRENQQSLCYLVFGALVW